MSKSNKWSVKKLLIQVISSLGVITISGGGIGLAFSETLQYEANESNAQVGTVGLQQGNLGNSVMSKPNDLKPGSNQYNYSAILFRPTFGSQGSVAEQAEYQFGQSSAPVDTVMILFDGRFDPNNPGKGGMVGNDDSTAHPSDVKPVKCGSSTSYCPSIKTTVTAGNTYTLWISTYKPGNPLDLPLGFYVVGNVSGSGGGGEGGNGGEGGSENGGGEFGSYDNLGTIDPIAVVTKANYNRIWDLDFYYLPIYNGGTMRLEKPYGTDFIYDQNFTLSSHTTNALDLNGHDGEFDGIWSDVTGQKGVLNIVNVTGSSDNTVTFTGDNTFTGGFTLGEKVILGITKASTLGASAANLTFDGGKLTTTGTFEVTQGVTINDGKQAGINVEQGSDVLTMSSVINGSGSLLKTGTGKLVLSKNNTYTGTTTVNSGILQLGNGGASGEVKGNIVNNDSVIFNRSDLFDFFKNNQRHRFNY